MARARRRELQAAVRSLGLPKLEQELALRGMYNIAPADAEAFLDDVAKVRELLPALKARRVSSRYRHPRVVEYAPTTTRVVERARAAPRVVERARAAPRVVERARAAPRVVEHARTTTRAVEHAPTTKDRLVAAVMEKAQLRKSIASRAVDAVFDSIEAALRGGDEVRLVGFGTFSVAARAASEGRNPRTGEKIKVSASKQAKFKPGKKLRDFLS